MLRRLNESADYRRWFARVFPDVAAGLPIHFAMLARAIAEFEFSLTFADAPIDRFARGERVAMSAMEKEGTLLFFGEAGCVACHAVAGPANEMFSDFSMHVIGVPQLAPTFGIGSGNVIFDGPGEDEDFGLEQVTGDATDRYKFRTSPLRNVAMQPAFFHNGSFTRLEDAIRHHLNVFESARYTVRAAEPPPSWCSGRSSPCSNESTLRCGNRSSSTSTSSGARSVCRSRTARSAGGAFSPVRRRFPAGWPRSPSGNVRRGRFHRRRGYRAQVADPGLRDSGLTIHDSRFTIT